LLIALKRLIKYLKFIQKIANTSKQRLAFCLKQIKEAVVVQINLSKPFEKLQIFYTEKSEVCLKMT
jgi:hypothetical protein